MKAERLFRAIGLVDEGLIEAAAETPAKKRPVWRRYAAAAACLMVSRSMFATRARTPLMRSPISAGVLP